LWPTVLRTRMVAGVERAVRWSPPLALGLAATAAGLATQHRAVALAWPLRVAVVNLEVALLVAWPAGQWVSTMGWWLAGLGLGSFIPLAATALLASHLRTEEAT
jgi:hypothetical protein